MSLRQIAKELGISPAYLSYMLNGKRPWRKDLYQRYMGVVNAFVNSDGALANHEEQQPHLMAYSGMNQGMAQSGRAPAWGVGGRRFESDHPDQKTKILPLPSSWKGKDFLYWCGKNLFDRENLGNPDTHEFP